jgi:hypothetical protein
MPILRKQNILNALEGMRIITVEWSRNMLLSHIGKRRGPLTEEHKKRIAELQPKSMEYYLIRAKKKR